ncbi:hypothetical protein M409DRAFT_28630 [Zasmidium cellare ATCC 36951]|uniref:Large ribosomal subunit protein uL4m n=1 Tax=Zasmidium cellare ATCC 36951 TaxID=1080233 RepID=A0A6A6C283_ZASCE|nr:uncharacterized protein M409DRAFT_28630 [Zasmidium cellare ATCC 36951]KAF2161023.1 hypothetical protein M409DRAFT_28630 [Zasmidium cellare ATCC 36951]
MASKRAAVPAKHLFNGFRAYENPTRQYLTRSMATEAPLPNATLSKAYNDATLTSAETQPILEDKVSVPFPTPSNKPITQQAGASQPPPNPFLQTVQCTLYDFPSLEPVSFARYPSTHLLLPLRKDLLHRAVIYEADAARSGTATTKWRADIHGSGKKVRPQKGTGSARLGDKKSPMLRGGGVAHGPKARDMSTELPKKVYDLAWRTALSYRWKMGQLLVTDSEVDIPGVHENSWERYMRDVLAWNKLGRSGGRTLFVADDWREGLFSALEGEGMEKQARARTVDTMSVKDLLLDGRLVVERKALETMLVGHETDLSPQQKLGAWERMVSSEVSQGSAEARS